MKHLVLMLLISVPTLLLSQNGGQSVFEFLNIPSTAQSLMNGGVLPVHNAADLGLTWENPAALSNKHHMDLQLDYTFYFADASYTSAIFSYSRPNIGNLALGVRHLGYGEFTQADEFGTIQGNFTAQDNAIDVFWSRSILDSLFSVGIGSSLILSDYESYNSTALAATVGVNYHSKDKLLSIGLVFRNFGRQLKTFSPNNYERLPYNINLAVSKKLAHSPFRLNAIAHDLQNWQLDYSTDGETIGEKKEATVPQEILKHLSFGIEFVPTEKFKVGFSYNHKNRQEMNLDSGTGLAGFSWGVAIQIKRFKVQFANSFTHRAAATQMFSLAYSFAKKK